MSDLIDIAPGEVLLAARQQRAALRNPPRTVDEFLDTLLRQQLPRTVTYLRGRKELL